MKLNKQMYRDFVDNCHSIDRKPLPVLSAMAFYFTNCHYTELLDIQGFTYTVPVSSQVEIVIPDFVVSMARFNRLSLDSFVSYLILWFNNISLSGDFDFDLRRLLNAFAPFED